MRKAVDVVAIKDGKLLVVTKDQTVILPGGKPEEGENDEECLRREVGEELNRATLGILTYYGTFEGTTPHTGDQILVEVYRTSYVIGGEETSGEVQKPEWLNATELATRNLSEITTKIVAHLCANGLVY